MNRCCVERNDAVKGDWIAGVTNATSCSRSSALICLSFSIDVDFSAGNGEWGIIAR